MNGRRATFIPHRPDWARRDTRVVAQILGAAIPGAVALGMAALCICLASQGVL